MTLRYEFKPTPLSREGGPGYQASIVLTNTTGAAMNVARLTFSSARILKPGDIQGAELLQRDGDLHVVGMAESIPPGVTKEIFIKNPRDRLLKITDWPYGVFAEDAKGTLLDLTIVQPSLRWDKRPTPVSEPNVVRSLIPAPSHLTMSEVSFPRPNHGQWVGINTSEISGLTPEVLAAWARQFQEFAGVSFTDVRDDLKRWPVKITRAEGHLDGYQLRVMEHGAELIVMNVAGVHAGLASLVQWVAGLTVQPVTIQDRPRFDYRGLHLDAVRHFIPFADVLKTVRLAALYKLNYLHWHLTDDEGWRLESTAFPELTKKTAMRGRERVMPPQMGSGAIDHGGYYSQSEVRTLVAYAAALGITVVPEMDVPGHARALLRALPELIEEADDSEYRSVQHYSDNVLNPGLSATLGVVKTLLDEIMDLFPAPYIHLGSDEVPEGVWENSPAAQEKAKALRLPNVRSLHGWLMRELEQHVQTRGRNAAGWEEILVDEAVSTATLVYSWQGVEAGRLAAQRGHDVVMTPAQYCYLDLGASDAPDEPGYYWAGTPTLSAVYGYEPTQGWEHDVAERHLKGMQACLWTELLAETWQREYMLLPRLLAVAERAWSSMHVNDLANFKERVALHQSIWQRAGWHYNAHCE
ncbi:beta-N-acetylhexosaminidase [Salinispirillum marinum]|uniref:beta-N-acetylhexosaminidase n=2 Tax=Saccharospirillaceae TaxID=255527 RepID=A0ABV8BI07_9GAMM